MITNGTPRKRHVLILDDDIALAWSLKETLERRGYEATVVPEGTLALKFVSEHTLDAVVCDLHVVRLEADLLHATIARSNPVLAERFIFIAGNNGDSPFEKLVGSSELLVLHKPVEVDWLADEVMRMAERNFSATNK
jgi:DNA-binding NtrC family response regulator